MNECNIIVKCPFIKEIPNCRDYTTLGKGGRIIKTGKCSINNVPCFQQFWIVNVSDFWRNIDE